MNRPLMFRTWDKQRGAYAMRNDCSPSITCHWESETNPIVFALRADDFIVEQFTGQEDADDREIYEGDIIEITRDDGEKSRTVVKFQDGGFVVDDDFGESDLLTVGWAIDAWDASGDRYIVIGNIHENPELLKGGEADE